MPVLQPHEPAWAAFLQGASNVAGDIGKTRKRYRDEERDDLALDENLQASRQRRRLNDDANQRANARDGRDAEFDALRNTRLKQAIDQGEEQSDFDLDEYDANTRDSLGDLDWNDVPEEVQRSIAGARRQAVAEAKGPKRKNLVRQLNDLNRRDIEAAMRESTLADIGAAVSQGRFAENPGAHESASMLLRALHSGRDDQGRDVDVRQVRTLWKQLSDGATEDDYQMNERASVSADIDSVLQTGMSRTARAKALRLRADLRHHKVSPEEAQDELDLITQGVYDGSSGRGSEDPRMKVLEMAMSASKGFPEDMEKFYAKGLKLLGLDGSEAPTPPPGDPTNPGEGGGEADYTVPDPGVSPEAASEAKALPVDLREELRELVLKGDPQALAKLREYTEGGSVLDKTNSDRTKREREADQRRIQRGGVDPTMRR